MPDRHQVGLPGEVLLLEQPDRVGTVGRRFPAGVAGGRCPVPRLLSHCPVVVDGRVGDLSHSHRPLPPAAEPPHSLAAEGARGHHPTRMILGPVHPVGVMLSRPRRGSWLHWPRDGEDDMTQQLGTGRRRQATGEGDGRPAGGRSISMLDGIRPYRRSWLRTDIVAGITLAALAIPEVMGYTKIAGMPVITGLYTILLPIAAFALFGSSRHLVVGADSATAAIMFAGIASLGISGLQPATPQWVALAGLERAACRRAAAARPGGPPRLPRRLPVADGADRVPDRRRRPGGRPARWAACWASPSRPPGSRSSAATSSSSSRRWATSARRHGRRRWSRRRCSPS